MPQHKVILVIMDGWGIGQVEKADAIRAARTPFVDALYQRYPHTTLTTCGEAVGLPDGQMGNSEVGHLNLGAGRIVYQELQRINVAIREGEMARNPELLAAIDYAKAKGRPLHLMGLVSDGGVHSHTNHLKALVDICRDQGLSEVYIHAFTDGRDTDPRGGLDYVRDLEAHLQGSVGTIATVSGRYYAMDRDNRWERVQKAWDVLVNAKGETAGSATEAISASYARGVTDEFILPTVILRNGQPLARLQEGDAVLCFNFRTDRCREITRALTQTEFPTYGMHPLSLYYATMTEYDATFENVKVLFRNDNLNRTLGEVISEAGRSQIRIAETEKYPHVTFFFSGGRETPFEGERRIMVPSPKVATYDLQPEMSALPITDAIVAELQQESADFICLNYANADMVGHTGVWEAVVSAVETVDTCVGRVVTTALEHGYTVFLTADHGNSDFMINEAGSPNTAHTTNPVPLFIISNHWNGPIRPGKLGDMAPTILHFMELPVPAEMSGDVLVDN